MEGHTQVNEVTGVTKEDEVIGGDEVGYLFGTNEVTDIIGADEVAGWDEVAGLIGADEVAPLLKGFPLNLYKQQYKD